MGQPGIGRVADELTCTNGRRVRIIDLAGCAPDSPEPMCFSPSALATLLAQVGDDPPEAGALLFGPRAKYGTDVVEKDRLGSQRASRAVFAPDAEWGTSRIQYWLQQPGRRMRLKNGICHSHPGDYGRPSTKAGPAIGDLGFVEAEFDANPPIQYYSLPILTNTGRNDAVDLYPWMVSRDAPGVVLAASFTVCQPEEFPDRVFNPEVERLEAQWKAEARQALRHPVDCKRLGDLLGVRVRPSLPQPEGRVVLELKKDGVAISLTLAPGFPDVAPEVVVVAPGARFQHVPFPWHTQARLPLEAEGRLADLCSTVLAMAVAPVEPLAMPGVDAEPWRAFPVDAHPLQHQDRKER